MGETERYLKARLDEHRRPGSNILEVSRHIHTDCQRHNQYRGDKDPNSGAEMV